MYCSIKLLHTQIKSKMSKNGLINDNVIDFERFKLVDVFKPMNDSTYATQNIGYSIKEYCTNINYTYKQRNKDNGNKDFATNSVYNANKCILRIIKRRRKDAINYITNQFENAYINNLFNENLNQEEQDKITEFFQDVYVTNVKKVVDDILKPTEIDENGDEVAKTSITRNNILLANVSTKLLTFTK